MMISLFFFSVLLLSANARRLFRGRALQDEEILSFQVTYRDFLPSSCFYEVGNATLEQISIDAWDGRAASDRDNCGLLVADPNWRQAFNDGIISGHPDMNSNGQKVSLSGPCNAPGRLPAASCQFEADAPENQQIILGDNPEDKSGIPKLVYCLPDPEDRCGFLVEPNGGNAAQTQSQKKFFDLWFEDDLKFNKRIGQRLNLLRERDGNGNFLNTFAFSSKTDDDAPDGDLNVNFFGPLGRFKVGANSLDPADFPDPRDAPAWPQAFANIRNDNSFDDIGYWMTTELHTTFLYLEDEPMEFFFSGDDDFWAFINGQMAVDLGGTHAELQATIDLNEEFEGVTIASRLGLTSGEVYTLDIYHAERNIRGSNFAVTTNLFPACNVVQSGTVAVDLSEGVNAEEFGNLFDFNFNVQQLSSNSFQIADSTPFAASFIFTKLAENVGRGFIATFEAEITAASDGFAFVVQNRGNNDYPLSSGGNFNVFGVTNSFAVVFDFCANRNDNDFQTCEKQEVRIHHQDLADVPNEVSNETLIVEEDYVRSNGNRFNPFNVEIVYFGGSPNFLEVYIDDSLYLRESDFPVEDILGGLGGFVGFTSSSGLEAGDVVISNFVLSTVEVDPVKSTTILPDENATTEIIADGEELAEGISFQTFDNCDNVIDTGTLAGFANALFIADVEESGSGRRLQNVTAPHVETGVIVDNNDGSYTAFLKTTVPGNYSVHIAFGDDCSLAVEEVDGSFEVVLDSAQPDLCFQDSLASIVTVLPVEEEEEEEFEDVEDDANDELTLILATGGGGVCCLAFLGAVLFAWYRAKWRKNEKFVDPGAAYKLEVNTQYHGNSEYTATGKAVLESQREILELQSAAAQNTRGGEIQQLTKENTEMKELLKNAKQQSQTAVNPRYTMNKRTPKKRSRQEF